MSSDPAGSLAIQPPSGSVGPSRKGVAEPTPSATSKTDVGEGEPTLDEADEYAKFLKEQETKAAAEEVRSRGCAIR